MLLLSELSQIALCVFYPQYAEPNVQKLGQNRRPALLCPYGRMAQPSWVRPGFDLLPENLRGWELLSENLPECDLLPENLPECGLLPENLPGPAVWGPWQVQGRKALLVSRGGRRLINDRFLPVFAAVRSR